MLLSQACFNADFLMFLLWILYYVRLLSRAVQVRQQQGMAKTTKSLKKWKNQTIEVVTKNKYPEEHDERLS